MRLSRFTDYSLRVLIFAALKGDAFSLSEAAEAYGISRNHLVKVVNHLAKLGYLETKRGRGGGIELGMLPENIKIGLLVRRTENSPCCIIDCLSPKAASSCAINGMCRLKGILAQGVGAFYAALDRYSLADLVNGPERGSLIRTLLNPSYESVPTA